MPFLLMDNKTDFAVEHQVKTSEGRAAARSLRCSFYEVSAKRGERGEQTMHDFSQTIAHQAFHFIRPLSTPHLDPREIERLRAVLRKESQEKTEDAGSI